MLQTGARHVSTIRASIRLPLDRLVGATVVAAFVWLLLQDRIPPLSIYLLELYLTL